MSDPRGNDPEQRKEEKEKSRKLRGKVIKETLLYLNIMILIILLFSRVKIFSGARLMSIFSAIVGGLLLSGLCVLVVSRVKMRKENKREADYKITAVVLVVVLVFEALIFLGYPLIPNIITIVLVAAVLLIVLFQLFLPNKEIPLPRFFSIFAKKNVGLEFLGQYQAQKAIDFFESELRHCSEKMEREPKNRKIIQGNADYTLVHLGSAYSALGDWQKALEVFLGMGTPKGDQMRLYYPSWLMNSYYHVDKEVFMSLYKEYASEMAQKPELYEGTLVYHLILEEEYQGAFAVLNRQKKRRGWKKHPEFLYYTASILDAMGNQAEANGYWSELSAYEGDFFSILEAKKVVVERGIAVEE